MKEFCIVVVLYGLDAPSCPTIQSLIVCKEHLRHSKLVLWDNSPVATAAERLAIFSKEFGSFEYVSTPENMSLSAIYNRVYKANDAYKWMVFLDQDSTFGADYFRQVRLGQQASKDVHLFVPIIRHGNQIMSPGRLFFFKGSYRKVVHTGINTAKNMAVITSGMCVSMHYLNHQFAGFNEQLHFYGIDTYFSLQYRKQHETYYVLPCTFQHSLSINEVESYESKKKRFKNHVASMRIIAKDFNMLVRAAAELYLFFEYLKFRVKY